MIVFCEYGGVIGGLGLDELFEGEGMVGDFEVDVGVFEDL